MLLYLKNSAFYTFFLEEREKSYPQGHGRRGSWGILAALPPFHGDKSLIFKTERRQDSTRKHFGSAGKDAVRGPLANSVETNSWEGVGSRLKTSI